MKIVCKASNMGNDVRCSVCGQGFLVNWMSASPAERAQQFAAVVDVLRKHHVAMDGERAHPAGEFSFAPRPLAASETVKTFPQAVPAAA